MEKKLKINNIGNVPQNAAIQKEPILAGELTGYPSIDRPWLKYYSEEAKNTPLPKYTVYEYVKLSNENNLDKIAFEYCGKQIKYKELFDKIDEVAKSLKANGINKGDIITICLPNMPETFYLFYAISKIGAIANMVDPRSSEAGIKHYVNEVQSKLLISLDTIKDKTIPLLDSTSTEKIVFVSPSESLPLPLKIAYKVNEKIKDRKKIAYSDEIVNWSSFVDEGKCYSGNVSVGYEENMPVAIEHTGGTTGTPKGVVISNDALNIIAHHFMVSPLKFDDTQSWLDIMPPFIAYGIGNGLHLPLLIGMKVILIPTFDPTKFDELIYKHRPDNFAGTPVNWESIVRSKKLKNISFQNIVLPGVGGDSMNIELEKEANEFMKKHGSDIKVIKGYGLTEVCAAACACFGEANKLGSVGIPFLHNNFAIVEPGTDKELTYNTRGEICIYSPSTMLEYFNNPEETDLMLKKHSDGKIWVHTQDIGYIDNDGLVFVDGRMKRVIILYDGFKIFPFPIEKAITSIPEVQDCKVVGMKDPNHIQGAVPVAEIILKPEYIGKELQLEEKIKNVCSKELAEYTIPYKYVFRESFPKTNIGKVDFLAMEQELSDVEQKNNSVKQKKLTK